MKIKLDENLPLQIASKLQRLGHDVHTIEDEGLSGCNDIELWQAVQRDARFLLTQDMDFSDTRTFSPGSHHGIALLRFQTPSRRTLIERTEEVFRHESVSQWSGCFVVVTERKVRIRRPPASL